MKSHRPLIYYCRLLIASALLTSTCAVIASDATTKPSTTQATAKHIEKPTLLAWSKFKTKKLRLKSRAALIVDANNQVVYAKNADTSLPIASITKLMTAMVALDAKLNMNEKIRILKQDRDLIQLTGSRLFYDKAELPRKELLQLALMSSENRAAAAIGRTTFAGGTPAFIQAMNKKAKALGMKNSRFIDPAGLDPGNIATAEDLVRMVKAAYKYSFIRKATTSRSRRVSPYKKLGSLRFGNTNRLLSSNRWNIGLSKTGYLNESGRCLVMQANIANQSLYIVLMNSYGKLTPFGDSNRIRKWIEKSIKKS